MEMYNEFLFFNSTGAVPYVEGGYASRVENCTGYLAINTGTSIVRVNDTILYPGVPGITAGDAVREFGEKGDLFLGQIKIQFTAGGVPEVTINQTFYVMDKQKLPNAD